MDENMNHSNFMIISKNGIDIIVDKKTGYYNISKVNEFIHTNNRLFKNRNINKWISSYNCKSICERLKKNINTDVFYYIIKNGESTNIYIHPSLYVYALSWINVKYMIDYSLSI